MQANGERFSQVFQCTSSRRFLENPKINLHLWRYAYEHDALIAETGVLKTAFDAIVEAYFAKMPSLSRLE